VQPTLIRRILQRRHALSFRVWTVWAFAWGSLKGARRDLSVGSSGPRPIKGGVFFGWFPWNTSPFMSLYSSIVSEAGTRGVISRECCAKFSWRGYIIAWLEAGGWIDTKGWIRDILSGHCKKLKGSSHAKQLWHYSTQQSLGIHSIAGEWLHTMTSLFLLALRCSLFWSKWDEANSSVEFFSEYEASLCPFVCWILLSSVISTYGLEFALDEKCYHHNMWPSIRPQVE